MVWGGESFNITNYILIEIFEDTSFPHFREDKAITKYSDYLQNMDKQAPLDRQVRYLTGQAKVHDLEKHIDPVRCLLSNRVDQLVYKLYALTSEEIVFMKRNVWNLLVKTILRRQEMCDIIAII